MNYALFGGLVPGEQQRQESWMVDPVGIDAGLEDLLAGVFDLPVRAERLSASAGDVMDLAGDEVDSETGSDGGGSRNDEVGGPVAPERAAWRKMVVTADGSRAWKDYCGTRFEVRCFAVEWRGSVLLDKEKFLRGLYRAIEGEAGEAGEAIEASFIVGMEIRKLKADYFAVVRRREPVRWRDWRRELMFGHGVEGGEGEGEEQGLYVRVLVPTQSSAEGHGAFVAEMIGRCDSTYPDTYRYREAEMTREHNKSYARPGRKRKAGET